MKHALPAVLMTSVRVYGSPPKLRDYLVVWGLIWWPTSVETLFRNSEVPQKHAETTTNKDTVSYGKTIWNKLGTEEQPAAMEPFQVFLMRGLGYVMLLFC